MIWYSTVSLLSIVLLPAAQPAENADPPDAQAAAVEAIPPASQAGALPATLELPAGPAIPACNSYRLQFDYPLNTRQRTCIWASNLLTTSAVFGAGFASGYAQLFKTDPAQWERGPAGYARSYGSRYAAGMAKATGEYLANLILKEDPRPRLSMRHNPFARVWYAGSSLFVDWRPKDRQGKRARFAAATILGAAASGFSGMAWYPTGGNSVASALVRGGMSLAGSLAYAELY